MSGAPRRWSRRSAARSLGRCLCVVLAALAWPMAAQERAPDLIFVSTPPEVVVAMLELADVGPDDVVYDLGSGDGRIPIAAATRFGARGVGIEIEPELVADAEAAARAAGVSERVRFISEDFFTADISEATVVTLYLLPSLNLQLQPKLNAELRPGTRVVSHAFGMGDIPPERAVQTVDGRTLYFWTVPIE